MTLSRRFMSLAFAMLASAMVFMGATVVSQHSPWHAAAYADDANPPGDPAQHQLETTDGNGGHKKCSEIDEAKGGVLIGYIVPCIAYTVEHATQAMSQKMVDWLMPTVWAFITFVLVMFGVKAVQGEGQVHQQAIVLLLKIAMVVTILGLIPTYVVPNFYSFMNEGVQVVSTTIGDASQSIHCDVDKYGDSNTMPLWKQMDCLLGKLYGFAMGTDGKPSMLLAASVFGLLAGFFFGGTFGVIVFFACIGVLWSMMMLILRTAFTFLQSYLYASLLLLIAPLFLPLILLKVSTYYFEAWWKGIFACILLPIIITSYAMFATLLYDDILFAPNAKINMLFNYSKVQEAEHLPRQACDRQIAGQPAMRSAISGIEQSVIYNNPFMKHFSNPNTNGAGNLCAGLAVTNLEAKRIGSGEFNTDREAFAAFFKDAIKLFVVALLINAGFKNVQSFSSNIIGSPSVGLSSMQPSKSEAKMTQAFEGFKQGMMSGFRTPIEGSPSGPGGPSGSGFLRNIPNALRGGSQGLLDSIGRSTDGGE